VEMVYKNYIKRVLDLVVSSLGLLLFSPLFLILIFLIKLDSDGPVFFTQRRIGKGSTEFYIYKFRTMKITTPPNIPTHLLHNPGDYITRVGRMLRKYSLDELPQIINILRGEMSIVGPRPALRNQYDLLQKREKYGANDIAPGLTGWAQINGRDELAIDVKARLDGFYSSNISCLLDLKIFIITIFRVLKAEGIRKDENPLMEQNPNTKEVVHR
jgi:O-antigen biosynthesis protein WbqP